jgi:hypothetical protein
MAWLSLAKTYSVHERAAICKTNGDACDKIEVFSVQMKHDMKYIK